MYKFLERLRQKPKEIRQFFSIAVAGGVTGVIALVWVISFFATIQRTEVVAEEEATSLERIREKIDEGVALTSQMFSDFEQLKAAAPGAVTVEDKPEESNAAVAGPAVEELSTQRTEEEVGKKVEVIEI